ncbi:helix-turn-helix transcriptional regulator [Chitinophaga pinensis]|nr:helix-turn-helix transcriptional regulator [Chitinophaga pinensis]
MENNIFLYEKRIIGFDYLVNKMSEKKKLNRIKDVLRQQGRTQTWLAEKIGKSYVVVTNYCNNNSQPSIEILKKIADVVGVDVRELLEPSKPNPI